MPTRTENMETTPLLHFRLSRSQSMHDTQAGPRQLSTFSGVFIPCVLSMFSVILFLRLGFVVGNAGLLGAMAMYILAYFIVGMTVLSVCAISTNGAIEGGGAYFMISRALGPEFGGSIGIMFFFANIFSSALYLLGLIEAIMDNFGPDGFLLPAGSAGLPPGRWWVFLYSTILLFIAFIVCMVGAKMFAKTVLFIFLIVIVALISVLISFFVVPAKGIKYPHTNPAAANESVYANYSGLGKQTIHENIYGNYSVDYTTDKQMDFTTVFAVFFNGVTGIMAGANMSGDLKKPSRSIPLGTILACVFTYSTYNVVSLLVAATCTRDLLHNVYSFMQEINVWQPFVVVGIIAASFSAGLSNLIGASRVLNAVAKDDLIGLILRPFKHESANGNPWPAVMISWILVQVCLLVGQLNAIAPIVSVFFLLSYASTNVACLFLEWASAPNFRPSFRYFTWHTCLMGIIGCVVMMFLINPLYASLSIVVLVVLFFYIHYRSPEVSWGSISQALIFHQVRKYLLLLDIRKDHVKFWRPQMILMVSNPRSSCQLIQFVNDIKKGGLYVLGNVKCGNLDDFPSDPLAVEYNAWLSLVVDHLQIKAFVELTICETIREGIQHLLRISGLGGMKPNTAIFGFYDNCIPEDVFRKGEVFKKVKVRFDEEEDIAGNIENHFAPLRELEDRKSLTAVEYVMLLQDTIKLQKNLCVARYFHRLDRDAIFKSKKKMYMDVWPVNFFKPETAGYLDTACLFLLQLSTILHMVPAWQKKTIMRVFLCAENDDEATRKREEKLKTFLNELRIHAEIKTVTWEHCIALIPKQEPEDAEEDEMYPVTRQDGITDNYLNSINNLVRNQQEETVVTFCYLPLPPADRKLHTRYLEQLDLMTENFTPTLLVHGINAVTSTAL